LDIRSQAPQQTSWIRGRPLSAAIGPTSSHAAAEGHWGDARQHAHLAHTAAAWRPNTFSPHTTLSFSPSPLRLVPSNAAKGSTFRFSSSWDLNTNPACLRRTASTCRQRVSKASSRTEGSSPRPPPQPAHGLCSDEVQLSLLSLLALHPTLVCWPKWLTGGEPPARGARGFARRRGGSTHSGKDRSKTYTGPPCKPPTTSLLKRASGTNDPVFVLFSPTSCLMPLSRVMTHGGYQPDHVVRGLAPRFCGSTHSGVGRSTTYTEGSFALLSKSAKSSLHNKGKGTNHLVFVQIPFASPSPVHGLPLYSGLPLLSRGTRHLWALTLPLTLVCWPRWPQEGDQPVNEVSGYAPRTRGRTHSGVGRSTTYTEGSFALLSKSAKSSLHNKGKGTNHLVFVQIPFASPSPVHGLPLYSELPLLSRGTRDLSALTLPSTLVCWPGWPQEGDQPVNEVSGYAPRTRGRTHSGVGRRSTDDDSFIGL
jgi:hypothetical protein